MITFNTRVRLLVDKLPETLQTEWRNAPVGTVLSLGAHWPTGPRPVLVQFDDGRTLWTPDENLDENLTET